MTSHDADRPVPLPPANARPVLVIADDIGVFLAVARSLGRSGLAVDVATSEEGLPGLSSRYVRQVHRVPGYLKHPGEWLQAIAALDTVNDYGWIVPTSDSSLIELSRQATNLPKAKLAIVNREALEIFCDKAATRDLAGRVGVPVAQGLQISPQTAPASVADRLRFPIFLKPSRSYRVGDLASKQTPVMVKNEAELTRALPAFDRHDLLAEEKFEGEGVGVSVLADKGEIVLAWQHRRLEETGETGRSSSRRGEPLDSALYADVEKLCQETRLTGVAMFEFRQDAARSRHILIEVNPRFWGSLALAVEAGWDFPYAYWRMTHGERRARVDPSADRTIARSDLLGEFQRVTDGISSGFAARARAMAAAIKLIAEGIAMPGRFDSWATDDPAPHRAQLGVLLSYLAGAVLRAVRPLRR